MSQEINEELVEEIRLSFCQECSEGPERWEYETGESEICGVGADGDCRRKIRNAIARVLSAVRDGDLDEALGVVGRGEFVRNSLGLIEPSWNKPPTEALATKEPWHRFIALRREEGK